MRSSSDFYERDEICDVCNLPAHTHSHRRKTDEEMKMIEISRNFFNEIKRNNFQTVNLLQNVTAVKYKKK